MNQNRPTLADYILILFAVAFAALAAYLWFTLENTREDYRELATASEQYRVSSTAEIAKLSQNLRETQGQVEELKDENENLEDDLDEERDRNEEFEDQIRDITGTVGQLDKLSKTDPELLQKYSKVFFLNENYIPERLVEMDDEYLYDESEPEFIHSKARPFLEDLLDDAEDDGIDLWIVSAYRSFDEQASLKSTYTVTYGSGANTFSADQGYSEHQLGTTVDFTTTGLNGGIDGFETTEAYQWLLKNAHKYGFVLSYPEGNSYYVFEPWHWRFVGTDLADDLRDDDQHFYDLPQRELDKYLISIFD